MRQWRGRRFNGNRSHTDFNACRSSAILPGCANARPVLITNPRLVEIDMNLREYQYWTIIFYEIEYSLYTLWQSMSRVWRPGQTRKVKIFFSHYPGTLEENWYVK